MIWVVSTSMFCRFSPRIQTPIFAGCTPNSCGKTQHFCCLDFHFCCLNHHFWWFNHHFCWLKHHFHWWKPWFLLSPAAEPIPSVHRGWRKESPLVATGAPWASGCLTLAPVGMAGTRHEDWTKGIFQWVMIGTRPGKRRFTWRIMENHHAINGEINYFYGH